MNKSNRSRVFYCGMVNTNSYVKKTNDSIIVAAASNKMTAVIQAMRINNVRAFMVTMPVLGRFNKLRYVGGLFLRGEFIPQIIFPTFANPYIRKFFSIFYFGCFCLRTVKPGDVIVLYNHALEYMLGLLILSARGIKPILDIEDIPRNDVKGFFHWFDNKIFLLFMNLTSSKKIVVSKKLANRLGIQESCIIHGANRLDIQVKESKVFLKDGFVKIMYTGTLIPETGLNLFCETVQRLVNSLKSTNYRVEFFIAGFGGEVEIQNLKNYCIGSNVKITYMKTLTYHDYLNQMMTCDVGLCLKMPNSDITDTTFPSKVIEITTQGLLLISSRASDVPELFDVSNAVLLEEPTSSCLLNAFMDLFLNPINFQKKAELGQKKALNIFDQYTVGYRVVNFIMAA